MLQLASDMQRSGVRRDVWTYASLIAACQSCGNRWREALAFYQDMQDEGEPPITAEASKRSAICLAWLRCGFSIGNFAQDPCLACCYKKPRKLENLADSQSHKHITVVSKTCLQIVSAWDGHCEMLGCIAELSTPGAPGRAEAMVRCRAGGERGAVHDADDGVPQGRPAGARNAHLPRHGGRGPAGGCGTGWRGAHMLLIWHVRCDYAQSTTPLPELLMQPCLLNVTALLRSVRA